MNTNFETFRGSSDNTPIRAFSFAFLTLVLVIASVVPSAFAADGDLDTSFGVGGATLTNMQDDIDFGRAVAIQSDGKIVVAGDSTSIPEIEERVSIARYLPDGTLDPTFGIGGVLVADEIAIIRDMVIQPDGKIVVVGRTTEPGLNYDIIALRYNPDGSLDPTFGNAGEVRTDFYGEGDTGMAVTLQPDGKIVVVGQTDGPAIGTDFAVVRYLSDGNLDATFGVGGRVHTNITGLGEIAHDVAIQGEGKLVVVGRAGLGFGVARYETNGDLDLTFGTGGTIVTDFGGSPDEAFAVAILADGRIVAGGRATDLNNYGDFGLACYTTNGDLDPGFGAGGKVTTSFTNNERISDLVVQPDGKIVAVGLTGFVNPQTNGLDIALARYNPDGSLDPVFGIGGKVVTDLGATEGADSIALQTDCKIVVGGWANAINSSDSTFMVARFDAGGCNASPCPKPQGYWKNNPSAWPVDSLVLGSKTYSKAELLALLSSSTKTDASIIVARQFIAAKLNVENGAAAAPIASSITDADASLAAFAGKLPFKVKSSSAAGQTMTMLGGVFDGYNNGAMTPACNP